MKQPTQAQRRMAATGRSLGGKSGNLPLGADLKARRRKAGPPVEIPGLTTGQTPASPRRSPVRARSSAGTRFPYVLLNAAMTADGKLNTANRAVESFSSPRDQEFLLALRATADAVMSGARTIDLNPVKLGPGPAKYRALRRRRGLSEYNLRIIVSGSGSVNPGAEIFRHKFSPIIILTTRKAGEARLKQLRAIADAVKICGDEDLDFRLALRWLRQKWGVRRLLCEGGGEVNDALFRAGLVDEVHVTLCPKVFGGRGAPTLADGVGAGTLANAAQLKLRSTRRHGEELFLVYRVVKQSRPVRRSF
jgi:riboflavin-specific deaminase-like protein